MTPSFAAFSDELVKLVQHDVFKDRWKQGIKGAIVGGLGMGLGAAVSGLATRAIAKKIAFMLINKELVTLSRGAGILGGAGGLAMGAAMSRNQRLIGDSEKKAAVIMRALNE